MRKFTLRVRLAFWAFRNPDRLTMLHFETLRRQRDGDAHEAFMARRTLNYLAGMPGARENEAAL